MTWLRHARGFVNLEQVVDVDLVEGSDAVDLQLSTHVVVRLHGEDAAAAIRLLDRLSALTLQTLHTMEELGAEPPGDGPG